MKERYYIVAYDNNKFVNCVFNRFYSYKKTYKKPYFKSVIKADLMCGKLNKHRKNVRHTWHTQPADTKLTYTYICI